MDPTDITLVLQQIERGEAQAADRLLPLVYEELRALAAARMAQEAAGHTLQPTALVHEAWLRLGGDQQPPWQSRGHFFGAAAEAMRRILIDRARHRLAQRRGGGQLHVNLDAVELASASEDARIIRVHDALQELEAIEPAKAQLVKLRYFAGMTLEEAAQVLSINERTARRWWDFARARLLKELSDVGA